MAKNIKMSTRDVKNSMIFFEIINIAFMVLLMRGVYYPLLSIKRLIFIVFLWILAIILPFLINKLFPRKLTVQYKQFVSLLKELPSHKMQILLFLLETIIIIVISVLLGKVLQNILHIDLLATHQLFIFSILFLLYISRFYIKGSNRPEQLFLVFLLVTGMFYITVTPVDVGISADDGIHYSRATNIVEIIQGTDVQSSKEIMTRETIGAKEKFTLSEGERNAYYQKLNDESNIQITRGGIQYLGVYSITYIPYVIGMIVGKGLSLTFTITFKLAKFVNLLCYGLIIYFAMKKLRIGKIALAAVGLIPEVIFMACSYSYDPWVIAFTLYGFSYFVYFLQNKDAKVKCKDVFLMLGAYIIGCLPKATYFILMLPLFFLPRQSFESKRSHRKYLLAVLFSGLFLVGTFMLPMLLNGAGTGDVRGGTDVNATEQIKFILNNPTQFILILTRFLANYLSLDTSGGYTVYLQYVGEGMFATLTICLLIGITLLDKKGRKTKTRTILVMTVLASLLANALSAIALYISFTAVGSDTVAGCQWRYILPTLFPVLYMMSPDLIDNKIPEEQFTTVSLVLVCLISVTNYYLGIMMLF
ncbi:MAG: DUF2142 domain-containing protein [Erysipelotrichaceae bacterium]|jgi:uncharacterized membrane protein|nr:DUF2142 domain-containing protein [Erysipelotrichaceae bacterium]MCH4044070.1 DUF2142 domain-containing protein [Erysipelotrichaceae bacterium]MCH4121285.1 DUF2142 domain-containing protein [Erysipelotrichaceae bacterium]